MKNFKMTVIASILATGLAFSISHAYAYGEIDYQDPLATHLMSYFDKIQINPRVLQSLQTPGYLVKFNDADAQTIYNITVSPNGVNCVSDDLGQACTGRYSIFVDGQPPKAIGSNIYLMTFHLPSNPRIAITASDIGRVIHP